MSNAEFLTSKTISEFIKLHNPDQLVDLSGTGKAFIFNSHQPGPTLMFRAELDALPIQEFSELSYASKNQGVAHLCGHDGHMTILAGLSQVISTNRPRFGKVVILFQPAEEVEQGARDVVNHPNFKQIEPDYIFALHNLPGLELGKLQIREGVMTAASRGMKIQLNGNTSHAAEPENGISPAMAISKIIELLDTWNNDTNLFNNLTFSTIIYVKMGKKSFGTTPGAAEMGVTLRSFSNEDMEKLAVMASRKIEEIGNSFGLKVDFVFLEEFPAIVNDPDCVSLILESARNCKLEVEQRDTPTRWSEDFGYFTNKYKGALFTIGAGTGQPPLHRNNYDFPDELIPKAIEIFYQIYLKTLQ